MPHHPEATLIVVPIVCLFVLLFNSYRMGKFRKLDKFRTAAGIFVGALLGIASGIGFENAIVGLVVGLCLSVVLVILFNKLKREE